MKTTAWVLAALAMTACSTSGGKKSDVGGAGNDLTDGSDGVADSTDGTPGPGDGTDGTDGTNAADGTDGTDASDTTDGTDGTDGSACSPACIAPEECVDGTCQLPVVCEPGTWFCAGLTAKKQCSADGTTFLEPIDCPGEQYCSAGQCGLKCSLDPKYGAYVGCSFWAVDLPTWDDPTLPNAKKLPMAVVVSNPSELDAKLNFVAPPGVTFNFTDLLVPGLGSKVFHFPPFQMDGSNIFDMGIKIESERPVLVHQFNPWDNTFSNDASLLLPEPLLGEEHLVLSWPTDTRCLVSIDIPDLPFDPGTFGGPCSHSTVTVVAVRDDTEVFVRVTARIQATAAPPGVDPNTFTPAVQVIPKGGVGTFVLQKGQVLNLEAQPETNAFELADLTGTLVLTNQPAAVFSGHESAAVVAPEAPGSFPDPDNPDNNCCLDHLEEQLLPTNLLGKSYVCGKSKSRGGESDLWRVVAAADGVTLTTSPPIDGIHGKTLGKKGDFVEAFTPDSFVLDATGAVLVGQYLVSQGDTQNGTGDPSLIMGIPVERFRSTYLLMVPPEYSENYVTIMRKSGDEVSVDGVPVSGGNFDTLSNGWEVGWAKLSEGVHTVSGATPFGLTAYGYNSAVSYGYPGGLTIPGEANP